MNFCLQKWPALSKLERDLIFQRTREGLIAARGMSEGRPSKRNDKAKLVETLATSNYRIKDIIKETGLSHTTIYRILKTYERI